MPSRYRYLSWPQHRFARLLLAMALLPVSGVANAQDQAPSAAEIDWRPRSELPPEVRDRLPVFCEGGYLPSSAAGGQMPLLSGAETGEAPLEASALNARYQLDSELFLQGDVRLRQGEFQATGSEARYNQQTGQLDLVGPLVSRGEGFLLTGDSARYSVESGQLDINTATFLLHESEMRGRASSLSRVGEHQVLITDGMLTTCGPHQNDWSIVASDIALDQEEGFGTARHVRLEVLDTPVFYWPYITFPIDDRRKTGFLYPSSVPPAPAAAAIWPYRIT